MVRGEDERSCTQRLCRFVVHLTAWVTCLASISLGAVAVHFLSEVSGNGCRAARRGGFYAHLSSYNMTVCANVTFG